MEYINSNEMIKTVLAWYFKTEAPRFTKLSKKDKKVDG